jgi:hypothetical protein
MYFNIYVNRQLGHQLTERATTRGLTRNRLIHEVLERYIQEEEQIWPDIILQFKGVPAALSFESSRDELLHPREDHTGIFTHSNFNS